MVHIAVESKLNYGYRQPRYSSSNLFMIVINGEDGESHEYEVEAGSYAEAKKQGDRLAANMVDIQYIEVYQLD